MYPLTYYETFLRYEANDQVFVAMPFSPDFQRVYKEIIEPGIRAVQFNGMSLQPRIINRGTTGSPDIHERIFDAIVHSRLVLADMTVQSNYKGQDGVLRWQANANVAYEVGLACAWRNPEDILLIHQSHPQHAYSFDVQNLRHLRYDPADRSSACIMSQEIARALERSHFLAKQTYLKLVRSLSPSAIQYMRNESKRAFPVVAFNKTEMGMIVSCRIHAVTELLACRALKNRNILQQDEGKGVAVVYQWTELGLRMLLTTNAIDQDRREELAAQIGDVPEGSLPPRELMSFPHAEPPAGDPKPPSNGERSAERKDAIEGND